MAPKTVVAEEVVIAGKTVEGPVPGTMFEELRGLPRAVPAETT